MKNKSKRRCRKGNVVYKLKEAACMYKASDIAKWFLAHNRIAMTENGAEDISNLKLQKLLYYAQGCVLALTSKRLFDDSIEAWTHGPVVPSVYQEYKIYGSNGIIFDDTFDFNSVDTETSRVLIQVYEVFGQYSAWKLRNMTHNESPWFDTDCSCEISTSKIEKYFKENYISAD